MGKPFSDLEKRAIALISVQADYTQWPDVELKEYWGWKIRADMAAHKLDAASKRSTGRKLGAVYLEPFGVNLPEKIHVKVNISVRSNQARGTNKLTDAILGYKTPAADDTSFRLDKFRPARVYYRSGAAETSATRTSRITKREYKSFYAAGDEGFSYAFGKTADGVTEVERQGVIKTTLGAAINLISFSSEKLSL